MTEFNQSQLEKALRRRLRIVANGGVLPPDLTTPALAIRYETTPRDVIQREREMDANKPQGAA